MSSDVPTINLFDNDNSSGSFFETFGQQQVGGGGGEPAHSNVNHSSASPFDNHPTEDTSLFGKSDGHSFFDSLGGNSEPANQQSISNVQHHQHQNHQPNNAPSYNQQYSQQASYQQPATQPSASDSLFSSSQSDPSSLFFENLSISDTQQHQPNQHQEYQPQYQQYDQYQQHQLPPAEASAPATPQKAYPPTAPYPVTPPPVSYHTPSSALNAPLPTSPAPIHNVPIQNAPVPLHSSTDGIHNFNAPLRSSTDGVQSSNAPLRSSTDGTHFSPSLSSIPRRSSANDLPSTAIPGSPSFSHNIGPSPLARNSSYPTSLSQLDNTLPTTSFSSTPTSFPPLSSFAPPSTFVPPPASYDTNSSLTSSSSFSSLPSSFSSNTLSSLFNSGGIAPPSPDPSTHIAESSPLSHSSSLPPPSTSPPPPTSPLSSTHLPSTHESESSPLLTHSSSLPPTAFSHDYSSTPTPTSPIATSPAAVSPIETSPFATSPMATSPVPTSPIATSPVATSPTTTSPVPTSPISTSHAPESISPPPVSLGHEEAPIPHFADGGDDQNIFDSFLGSSSSQSFLEQSASSHTYDTTNPPAAPTSLFADPSSGATMNHSTTPSMTSSTDAYAATPSTSNPTSASATPASATPATSSDQAASSTPSDDQYSQYYAQYYNNYNYNNYDQYSTSQNGTSATSSTTSSSGTSDASATQYSNYNYSYNQQGYDPNAYSNYSTQYSQQYQQSSGSNATGYDYSSYQTSDKNATSHDNTATQYNNQYQYSTDYSNQYNNQYSNNDANQYSNNQYSNDQYSTQYSNQYSNYYASQNQYSNNQPYTDQSYQSSTTQSSYSYSTPSVPSSIPSVPSIPSSTANTASYSNWTPQQTGATDTLLFSRPHPVVSFGFCGKMAIFRPSSGFVDSRVLRVESVRTVLQNSPVLEPYTSFPGPLTSGTSKDAVTRWINDRIRQANDDGATLLWELLKVMSEHYGSLIRSPDSSSNPDVAIQKLLVDPSEYFDLPGAAIPANGSLQAKIQRLLLAGDRVDACKTAVTTHNWSHALLLAQFCGPEVYLPISASFHLLPLIIYTYANTITSFATTALPEGSPLRTMYLLHARQPQEIFKVTGASSMLLEKWKANLAAILATSSPAHASASQSASQSQHDRRVAAELGDRLWAVQGRVEAAHCCYLLADLALGPVDNPSTRIVLLGADHKRKRPTNATQQSSFPSNFVANLEAIQRSEIYEWAKVLGNSQYVLPGIHPYKLVYASFMADLGFTDVAVQYVQQLTSAVKAHKGGGNLFTPFYLFQLDTLEERLRGTGAAKLAASGSWIPRMLTKGFSRILGSEKGPSAPAAPVDTTPKKKGSSFVSTANRTPVRQDPAPPPAAATPSKEEEDYAASFSTKSTKKAEPKDDDGKEGKKAEKGKEGEKEGEPQQGRLLSRLAFWKRSGTEAKLGEENAFEYNAELQMWVEKGKPLPEPEAPLAPPPTMSFHTSTPPPSSSADGLSAPPPGTPPMMGGGPPGGGIPPKMGGEEANKFTSPVAAGGRRKPRYFDSLNEQVSARPATTPTATPDKANMKVFTPFTPPPAVFSPPPLPAQPDSDPNNANANNANDSIPPPQY